MKSRRKILPSVNNAFIEYTEEEERVFAFDLTNYVNSITRRENVDEDNINEWFNYNANDLDFEHLTILSLILLNSSWGIRYGFEK